MKPSAETRLSLLALFLVFLTLKLTHVIDWSWWWVTGPLWIPATACLAIAMGCVLVYFVLALFYRVTGPWMKR